MTRAVVEFTRRRAMVVAADRMWWTGRTVEFAAYCRIVGAYGLMGLRPDGCQAGTVQTLVDHYAQAARELPVMLVTNFTAKWPLPRSLELFRRLRDEVPGVMAVKDDVCGEMGRQLGLMAYEQWAILASGSKRMILNNVPYGCDGYLSSFIYFKPEIAFAFWDAVRKEDTAGIRRIIAEVDIPFWEFMESMPGSFDAIVHGILELKGIAERWRRPPYYSLNDAELAVVSAFIADRKWL